MDDIMKYIANRHGIPWLKRQIPHPDASWNRVHVYNDTFEASDHERGFWEKREEPIARCFTHIMARANVESLLDIGAGPGFASRFFKDNWPTMKVTMLDVAAHNPVNNPDCTFKICDAHDIPYISKVFDAVWMGHMLEHTLCPAIVLLEARRVLKDGGPMAVVVPARADVGTEFYAEVGHLWDFGNYASLLYLLASLGFDCTNAVCLRRGYSAAVFVSKGEFPEIGNLSSDHGLLSLILISNSRGSSPL